MSQEITEGSILKVESIESLILPHLEESIRDLMKIEFLDLIGTNFVIKYLGVRVPLNKVEEGSKSLAKIVNHNAKAFMTLGKLKGGFIKYDLFFGDELPPEMLKKGPETLLLAYLAFSPEAGEVIDALLKNKVKVPFFQQGGVPDEVAV